MIVYTLSSHKLPLFINNNNKNYMWCFVNKNDAYKISKIINNTTSIYEFSDKKINLPVSFLMKDPPCKNTHFNLYPYTNIRIEKNNEILNSIDIDQIDYDEFLMYPFFNISTILSSSIYDTGNEVICSSSVINSID